MNILFLTPRLPYPPIKGDKLRAFHQIRHLSKKHKIFLTSFVESKDEHQFIQDLNEFCQKVVTVRKTPLRSYLSAAGTLCTSHPLQVGYYRSRTMAGEISMLLQSHYIDLVHIQTVRMAPYVRICSRVPVILDLIDFISLNFERRSSSRSFPSKVLFSLEHRRMTRYERQIIQSVGQATAVSLADIVEAGQEGNPKVVWLPNGVDTDYFKPIRAEYQHGSLLFTGNMGYFPNVEAATYFCNKIFPRLLNAHPNFEFYIVGANPSKQVSRLAKQPSVVVTGTVPDIRPYYDRAHIFVCPMQSGAGMQNKILEAMAMGVPVISTSLSNNGIGAKPDKEILIADNPETFAAQVIKIACNDELRNRIAEAGQTLVRNHYSWTDHAESLDRLYQSLLLSTPRNRDD